MATTWKNLVCGPALSSIATRTAGWREFFAALEENAEWLKTVTPSECIASHVPLGRADLPTASYEEMMEWVLPTNTRLRFYGLHKEFSARPDVLTFLRGGGWRGFFRKYPESNLLHKKMLRVSACVAAVPAAPFQSRAHRPGARSARPTPAWARE